MASINLWQLITRAANDKDHSHHDEAEDLLQAVGKAGGFGNELSLEVNEHGAWTVRVFSCYDSDQHVEMRVSRHGDVQITRKKILATNVFQTTTLQMS